ncbi:helix-turn-helix domain-containing protein [Streptomyces sp. NPDC091279]|uniref:helix-turn-helix domain-containing protein n=1 Tax=Streptomyces sp. NPDC091279 TaxID=3365983 RepID=UPI0038125171
MTTRDDVEEFAALLRLLKARTDRSYGSLARRLSMNTSTLHRYCAGEAVPTEFAPVERLAAFCEATPEERHELHRRWLLAVAARQRPKPTEAAEAGATAPAEPSETAGPAETAETAPPSPHSPRPWFRRRRTLVAAAATTVLLATLSSLSAPPPGHSPADAAGTPSRSPAPSWSRTPAPPNSPSPGRSSASPPATTGTPSPAAAGKGGEKEGHEKGAKAAAPTGGAVSVPLTWTADSQIWNQGCGHDYIIDKQPAQVPPPPMQQDAAAWAATQGAVHGHQTMVQISVQGTSSTAVVLEALRVRVTGRGTPLKGISYAMEQGCGGELTPRTFAVNLDMDRPIARSMPGADSTHTIPAVRFPYRVSATDPEVLLVTAETERYDASWYLELDWSSQGRTGTARVDDHGRPFRTSGNEGLPRYWYGTKDGQRQWVPYQ